MNPFVRVAWWVLGVAFWANCQGHDEPDPPRHRPPRQDGGAPQQSDGASDTALAQSPPPPPLDPLVGLPADCPLKGVKIDLVQNVPQPLWPYAFGAEDTTLVEGKHGQVLITLRWEQTQPGMALPPRDVLVTLSGNRGPLFATHTQHATVPTPTSSSNAPQPGTDATTTTSQLRFPLAGDAIAPGMSLTVAIVLPERCADGPAATTLHFPAEGTFLPSITNPGTLRVRLIPISYEADGSHRIPTLDAPTLARLKEYLEAIYPIRNLQLQIGPTIESHAVLTYEGGWDNYLTLVHDQRVADTPEDDIHYMGLVLPNPSRIEFCILSCVGGKAYINTKNQPDLRAGVVLGDLDDRGLELFAHELGHQLGLLHAPCASNDPIDPDFPDEKGFVGHAGFDAYRCTETPTTAPDFMTGCKNPWIGPYHHRKLLTRIQSLNKSRDETMFPIAAPVCPAFLQPEPEGVSKAQYPLEALRTFPSSIPLGQNGLIALDPEINNIATAVDHLGVLVIAGQTHGDVVFANGLALSGRHGTSFVAKIDPQGRMLWLHQGNLGFGSNSGLAVDGQGQIFIARTLSGRGFIGPYAFNSKRRSCLLVRISSTGQVQDATMAHATGENAACHSVSLAVDDAGHATLAAKISGTFSFGDQIVQAAQEPSVVVARAAEAGQFSWVRVLANNGGNPMVTTNPSGTSTYLFQTGQVITGKDNFDATIAPMVVESLGPEGETLWRAHTQNGNVETSASATVDAEGNIYFAGRDVAIKLSGHVGRPSLTTNPGTWMAKLGQDGIWQWNVRPTYAEGTSVQMDGLALMNPDGFVVAGSYQGAPTIGPTALADQPESDIFVAKVDPQSGDFLSAFSVQGNGAERLMALSPGPPGPNTRWATISQLVPLQSPLGGPSTGLFDGQMTYGRLFLWRLP